MARKLKLIPPTAENAKGFDFEMHFNPHSLRPDQGALTDFKGTIKVKNLFNFLRLHVETTGHKQLLLLPSHSKVLKRVILLKYG